MAESKELKPKSFRIDDETAEKFKEIAASIGGNQQETLAKLIESYEFQSGKSILTDKKPDIEQFEKYITAITRMYMGSLEDNLNMTEIVRTEFDALLKSKDTSIQNLQEQLAAAKQVTEEAVQKAKLLTDQNSNLKLECEIIENDYKKQVEHLQAMLTDKDHLNKALTDSCNDLKERLNQVTESESRLSALMQEHAELQAEHTKLAAQKNELAKKNESLIQQFDQLNQEVSELQEKKLLQQEEHLKLKQDKEMLLLKQNHMNEVMKYQKQIQDLKAESIEEIQKYQNRYLELLEKLQQENKN